MVDSNLICISNAMFVHHSFAEDGGTFIYQSPRDRKMCGLGQWSK